MVRGSAHASRLRALPALVVALVLLVPAPPVGAASRPVERGAAVPVSQLLRHGGLSGLLPGLLPSLFGPPRALPRPPFTDVPAADLVRTVAASTVKISGVACGRRVAGSGFSAGGPDTVVTNAHVVAGVRTPEVLAPDGRRLTGQVQAFDPNRDLAVLEVRGLGQAPLGIGSATAGDSGAVFGHPHGQVPVEVSPAHVVAKVDARVTDIYGEDEVARQVVVLDAELEPGDSGGALVNQSGSVVGVAFAVSAWFNGTAFAVASEELPPVLAQARNGAASTGPCLR